MSREASASSGNTLQTMGLQLGAAVTPPLIATLMHFFGWRNAILWTTIPALGLIGCWAWYGRNTPREHPSVSREELAEIGVHAGSRVNAQISLKRVMRVLANRQVLLLSVSYLTMNYAFYLLSNWAFLYLIQERHFSVLESGWLSGVPPLAAAVGSGVGGMLTGWACSLRLAAWPAARAPDRVAGGRCLAVARCGRGERVSRRRRAGALLWEHRAHRGGLLGGRDGGR
jgi:MFS transporter, ACS family, glucarate transporter